MRTATYRFADGDVLTITETERDLFTVSVTSKRTGDVTTEERLTPYGLHQSLRHDWHMTDRVVKNLVAKVRTTPNVDTLRTLKGMIQ